MVLAAVRQLQVKHSITRAKHKIRNCVIAHVFKSSGKKGYSHKNTKTETKNVI